MSKDEFAIPDINPMIKVFEAQAAADGTPQWTVYNPVSNEYFLLSWAQFECLIRFQMFETIGPLVESVRSETTLDVDEEDVKSLIKFLNLKGFISGDYSVAMANAKKKDQQAVLTKLIHSYLFFTVPLFKPQKFLEATLPYVKPLFSFKTFAGFMILLVLGILITLPRSDEFFGTFPDLISFEGLALFFVSMFVIKAFHEMAHAYVATLHGVPVPHMGAAFIVMYPILYTEATGSWRLKNRWHRLHIGIAGVMVELYISTIFLFIWNIALPGPLQTVSFLMVAITMVGSLLVNLNPLMKFDGYYVMCDFLGMENIQKRATDFARWRLRKFLFGLNDPAPEGLSEGHTRFLTVFGFALMIYRFFLFLGIAIMVYYVFLKPLGFVMMMIELIWFIGKPVLGEVKIWWTRRNEIMKTWQTGLSAIVLCVLAAVFFIPGQHTVAIPAVKHAQKYFSAYPPVPARIETLSIKEGQSVAKGEVLAVLSAEGLDNSIKSEETRIKALENTLRRMRFSEATSEEKALLEDEIARITVNLEGLYEQQEKLTIKAPFDGVIVDFSPQFHAGRSVDIDRFMFRVTGQSSIEYTGYVSEQDLPQIDGATEAVYVPDGQPLTSEKLLITNIKTVNAKTLAWPELSSIYGGRIASDFEEKDDGGRSISPMHSVYPVSFKPAETISSALPAVQTGTIFIKGRESSAALSFMNRAFSLFIRELGLN